MATIDHLPPELLGLILSHLFGLRETLQFKDYLGRQKDLCSCALVRSSWRFEAQQLLVKEIWITKTDNTGKLLRGTARPPFDTLKVQSLTIESIPLELLVDEAEKASGVWERRWEEVTYLEMINGGLTDRGLARFPNLGTLSLCSGSLWTVDNPTEVSLPQLRRLVLDAETTYDGSDQDFFQLFAPSNMPRLTHLSICAQWIWVVDLLKNILPQIVTIAISSPWSNGTCSALIRTTSSSSVLLHLAFDGAPGYTFRDFARDAAGLNLHSLNVPWFFFQNVPQEDVDQLFDEEDRSGRQLHVRSLVVYGAYGDEDSDEDLVELRSLLAPHGAKVRHGLGDEPPFDTFDGAE